MWNSNRAANPSLPLFNSRDLKLRVRPGQVGGALIGSHMLRMGEANWVTRLQELERRVHDVPAADSH